MEHPREPSEPTTCLRLKVGEEARITDDSDLLDQSRCEFQLGVSKVLGRVGVVSKVELDGVSVNFGSEEFKLDWSSFPSEVQRMCPEDCILLSVTTDDADRTCDGCLTQLPKGTPVSCCEPHGFDLCGFCCGTPLPVTYGTRVVRGPTWKYQNQDGGPYLVGTVTDIDSDMNAWVEVMWDQTQRARYRSLPYQDVMPVFQGGLEVNEKLESMKLRLKEKRMRQRTKLFADRQLAMGRRLPRRAYDRAAGFHFLDSLESVSITENLKSALSLSSNDVTQVTREAVSADSVRDAEGGDVSIHYVITAHRSEAMVFGVCSELAWRSSQGVLGRDAFADSIALHCPPSLPRADAGTRGGGGGGGGGGGDAYSDALGLGVDGGDAEGDGDVLSHTRVAGASPCYCTILLPKTNAIPTGHAPVIPGDIVTVSVAASGRVSFRINGTAVTPLLPRDPSATGLTVSTTGGGQLNNNGTAAAAAAGSVLGGIHIHTSPGAGAADRNAVAPYPASFDDEEADTAAAAATAAPDAAEAVAELPAPAVAEGDEEVAAAAAAASADDDAASSASHSAPEAVPATSAAHDADADEVTDDDDDDDDAGSDAPLDSEALTLALSASTRGHTWRTLANLQSCLSGEHKAVGPDYHSLCAKGVFRFAFSALKRGQSVGILSDDDAERAQCLRIQAIERANQERAAAAAAAAHEKRSSSGPRRDVFGTLREMNPLVDGKGGTGVSRAGYDVSKGWTWARGEGIVLRDDRKTVSQTGTRSSVETVTTNEVFHVVADKGIPVIAGASGQLVMREIMFAVKLERYSDSTIAVGIIPEKYPLVAAASDDAGSAPDQRGRSNYGGMPLTWLYPNAILINGGDTYMLGPDGTAAKVAGVGGFHQGDVISLVVDKHCALAVFKNGQKLSNCHVTIPKQSGKTPMFRIAASLHEGVTLSIVHTPLVELCVPRSHSPHTTSTLDHPRQILAPGNRVRAPFFSNLLFDMKTVYLHDKMKWVLGLWGTVVAVEDGSVCLSFPSALARRNSSSRPPALTVPNPASRRPRSATRRRRASGAAAAAATTTAAAAAPAAAAAAPAAARARAGSATSTLSSSASSADTAAAAAQLEASGGGDAAAAASARQVEARRWLRPLSRSPPLTPSSESSRRAEDGGSNREGRGRAASSVSSATAAAWAEAAAVAAAAAPQDEVTEETEEEEEEDEEDEEEEEGDTFYFDLFVFSSEVERRCAGGCMLQPFVTAACSHFCDGCSLLMPVEAPLHRCMQHNFDLCDYCFGEPPQLEVGMEVYRGPTCSAPSEDFLSFTTTGVVQHIHPTTQAVTVEWTPDAAQTDSADAKDVKQKRRHSAGDGGGSDGGGATPATHNKNQDPQRSGAGASGAGGGAPEDPSRQQGATQTRQPLASLSAGGEDSGKGKGTRSSRACKEKWTDVYRGPPFLDVAPSYGGLVWADDEEAEEEEGEKDTDAASAEATAVAAAAAPPPPSPSRPLSSTGQVRPPKTPAPTSMQPSPTRRGTLASVAAAAAAAMAAAAAGQDIVASAVAAAAATAAAAAVDCPAGNAAEAGAEAPEALPVHPQPAHEADPPWGLQPACALMVGQEVRVPPYSEKLRGQRSRFGGYMRKAVGRIGVVQQLRRESVVLNFGFDHFLIDYDVFPASYKRVCYYGCELKRGRIRQSFYCSSCFVRLPLRGIHYGCRAHDFDLCLHCCGVHIPLEVGMAVKRGSTWAHLNEDGTGFPQGVIRHIVSDNENFTADLVYVSWDRRPERLFVYRGAPFQDVIPLLGGRAPFTSGPNEQPSWADDPRVRNENDSPPALSNTFANELTVEARMALSLPARAWSPSTGLHFLSFKALYGVWNGPDCLRRTHPFTEAEKKAFSAVNQAPLEAGTWDSGNVTATPGFPSVSLGQYQRIRVSADGRSAETLPPLPEGAREDEGADGSYTFQGSTLLTREFYHLWQGRVGGGVSCSFRVTRTDYKERDHDTAIVNGVTLAIADEASVPYYRMKVDAEGFPGTSLGLRGGADSCFMVHSDGSFALSAGPLLHGDVVTVSVPRTDRVKFSINGSLLNHQFKIKSFIRFGVTFHSPHMKVEILQNTEAASCHPAPLLRALPDADDAHSGVSALQQGAVFEKFPLFGHSDVLTLYLRNRYFAGYFDGSSDCGNAPAGGRVPSPAGGGEGSDDDDGGGGGGAGGRFASGGGDDEDVDEEEDAGPEGQRRQARRRMQRYGGFFFGDGGDGEAVENSGTAAATPATATVHTPQDIRLSLLRKSAGGPTSPQGYGRRGGGGGPTAAGATPPQLALSTPVIKLQCGEVSPSASRSTQSLSPTFRRQSAGSPIRRRGRRSVAAPAAVAREYPFVSFAREVRHLLYTVRVVELRRQEVVVEATPCAGTGPPHLFSLHYYCLAESVERRCFKAGCADGGRLHPLVVGEGMGASIAERCDGCGCALPQTLAVKHCRRHNYTLCPFCCGTSVPLSADARVVRGPTWGYAEQDSGLGSTGTVIDVFSEPLHPGSPTPNPACLETVTVKWDNGGMFQYFAGILQDLYPVLGGVPSEHADCLDMTNPASSPKTLTCLRPYSFHQHVCARLLHRELRTGAASRRRNAAAVARRAGGRTDSCGGGAKVPNGGDHESEWEVKLAREGLHRRVYAKGDGLHLNRGELPFPVLVGWGGRMAVNVGSDGGGGGGVGGIGGGGAHAEPARRAACAVVTEEVCDAGPSNDPVLFCVDILALPVERGGNEIQIGACADSPSCFSTSNLTEMTNEGRFGLLSRVPEGGGDGQLYVFQATAEEDQVPEKLPFRGLRAGDRVSLRASSAAVTIGVNGTIVFSQLGMQSTFRFAVSIPTPGTAVSVGDLDPASPPPSLCADPVHRIKRHVYADPFSGCSTFLASVRPPLPSQTPPLPLSLSLPLQPVAASATTGDAGAAAAGEGGTTTAVADAAGGGTPLESAAAAAAVRSSSSDTPKKGRWSARILKHFGDVSTEEPQRGASSTSSSSSSPAAGGEEVVAVQKIPYPGGEDMADAVRHGAGVTGNIRALSRVAHPNVLRLRRELRDDAGTGTLSVEAAEPVDRTLAEHVEAAGSALSFLDRKQLLMEVLRASIYLAKTLGVSPRHHLRLTPDNIFVVGGAARLSVAPLVPVLPVSSLDTSTSAFCDAFGAYGSYGGGGGGGGGEAPPLRRTLSAVEEEEERLFQAYLAERRLRDAQPAAAVAAAGQQSLSPPGEDLALSAVRLPSGMSSLLGRSEDGWGGMSGGLGGADSDVLSEDLLRLLCLVWGEDVSGWPSSVLYLSARLASCGEEEDQQIGEEDAAPSLEDLFLCVAALQED